MHLHRLILGLVLLAVFVGCRGPAAPKPPAPPEPDENDAGYREVEGPPFRAVWREILCRSMLDGQAHKSLRDLCDGIGGRLAGTEGDQGAARHCALILGRSREIKTRSESFAMTGWSRGSFDARFFFEPPKMNAHPCQIVLMEPPEERPVKAVALGHTPVIPADKPLVGAIVDVGFGTKGEFDSKGREGIVGRWALVKTGQPEGHRPVHRIEKLTHAERMGAIGMLFANTVPGDLPQCGTCRMGSTSTIAGVALSMEAGETIRRMMNDAPFGEFVGYPRGDLLRLKVTSQPVIGPVQAANTIAELTGTDPAAGWVCIGAHRDSWDLAQGAVDNGTGTVVVMEAARLLAATGKKPRRTIRFILFSGEELGLCGSRAYVEAHKAELDSCRLMVNLDMVGRPTEFQAYGCAGAVPFLKNLAVRLGPLGIRPDVPDKAEMHSDHQPFMMAGVPTATIGSKLEPDQAKWYHSAGDTFDKVNGKDLQDAATVAAILMWEVADAKEDPPCGPRQDDAAVRKILERDGLKEALQFEGDWRW